MRGRPAPLALLAVLLVPAALLSTVTQASAQQAGDTIPPTRQELMQARQDSIRGLMQQQLLLLGRGVTTDSATIRADSARLAGTRQASPSGRGGAEARDSIAAALLQLGGYVPTYYVGTEAIYDTQLGRLVLLGDSTTQARTIRDGTELSSSEQIVYDASGEQVRTLGVATLSPRDGASTTADGLIVDVDTNLATALGAETVIEQNAQWFLRGDLPIVYTEGGYGHDLQFTTCELEHPHYHFNAKELKWLRGADSVLVARSVTLRFAEVPVLWLPFFAQSTKTGRRSGLLTPTFSVNDIVRQSGSYQRRLSNLGYYWAISEYMDATTAIDWFSGNFTALNGQFRYNWRKQFLNGGLTARRFWRNDGGGELALSTQHSWDISERSSFRMSARYATSTDFISRNSFDPREVTGSIDSQGGFTRQFDWGNLNLSGRRQQFLNDDRVITNLPEANLSVRSITLFRASPTQASWYNNMAVGGNLRFSARSTDRVQEDGLFDPSRLDTRDLQGSASTSLVLGRFNLAPTINFDTGIRSGLPFDSLPFFADVLAAQGGRALTSPEGLAALSGGTLANATSGDFVDVSQTNVNWSVGAGYQQTLVSSTTLTPRVSLAGSWLRSDTVSVAQEFVASPTRLSFGAELRGDLFGFFPGFGNFEQIRHKVSPSFSWDYAPETTPTDLQTRVFGSAATRAQNVLAITLNQTFEAKRRQRAGDASEAGAGSATGSRADETGPTSELIGSRGEQLRRLEQGEVVSLLNLRTSAIQYDFVEADSLGRFIDGIRTTSINNQLSSDLLSGFTVQMSHDLFDEDEQGRRTFAPKLTRLNFGFRLDHRSRIANLWGLLGDGGDASGDEARSDSVSLAPLPGDEEIPLFGDDRAFGGGLESSIVPDEESDFGGDGGERSGGTIGQWSADLQYALTRNRLGTGSQTLQARFRLQPTELWSMSWATGYDIDTGDFADHRIRLTRDLHRWEANFDFVQTATGNWSFRFEVRLSDQQDLKLDYEQRSLQQDFFGDFPGR